MAQVELIKEQEETKSQKHRLSVKFHQRQIDLSSVTERLLLPVVTKLKREARGLFAETGRGRAMGKWLLPERGLFLT